MIKHYKHLSYQGNYVDECFLRRLQRHDLTQWNAKGVGVQGLFRYAIQHQMTGLRRTLKRQLRIKHFSLDHYPVSFAALKHIFLKQQGISPGTLTRNQVTVALIKDWQQFHGAMAEYRVIDPQVDFLLTRLQAIYTQGLDGIAYAALTTQREAEP